MCPLEVKRREERTRSRGHVFSGGQEKRGGEDKK